MGNIDSLRDWGHARDYVRMQSCPTLLDAATSPFRIFKTSQDQHILTP
jgi:GDP-D-mannose dehydratase